MFIALIFQQIPGKWNQLEVTWYGQNMTYFKDTKQKEIIGCYS